MFYCLLGLCICDYDLHTGNATYMLDTHMGDLWEPGSDLAEWCWRFGCSGDIIASYLHTT